MIALPNNPSLREFVDWQKTLIEHCKSSELLTTGELDMSGRKETLIN